jgi:hypothetical protein
MLRVTKKNFIMIRGFRIGECFYLVAVNVFSNGVPARPMALLIPNAL